MVSTVLTFNLNNELKYNVVLMVSSQYGNEALFFLTAVSGSLFVVLLSKFITNKFIEEIGLYSLYFFGLNGLFRDIINPKIVKFIPYYINESFIFSFSCSLIITIISLFFVKYVMLNYTQKVYDYFYDVLRMYIFTVKKIN